MVLLYWSGPGAEREFVNSRDILRLRDGKIERGGKVWFPTTPFLAVIGDPVAHSLSPGMHNAALAARDLPHEYLAMEVAAQELASLRSMQGLQHLVGFNVTSPHKEALVGMCEQLTDTAARIGAVNTVGLGADGKWVGHNTDSGGLVMVFSQARGEPKLTDRAVVLGTGGAARAAVDALLRWGLREIIVKYHTSAAEDHFRQWLKSVEFSEGVELQALSDPLPSDMGESCLWINALARNVAFSPFIASAVRVKTDLVIDLRYGEGVPGEHLPVGVRQIGGLPLLVMQGGLSFAWWFKPPVPWDALRKGLQE